MIDYEKLGISGPDNIIDALLSTFTEEYRDTRNTPDFSEDVLLETTIDKVWETLPTKDMSEEEQSELVGVIEDFFEDYYPSDIINDIEETERAELQISLGVTEKDFL